MKLKIKLEPKLVDMDYVDNELMTLFNSLPRMTGDANYIKHKSRFKRQQYNKNNPDNPLIGQNSLSLGKKLEILYMYGDYKLVKSDKKSEMRQPDNNKSDDLAKQLYSKVFDLGKEKQY